MPQDPRDEQIRRLLAEARHDAPVPDEVADRIDSTLARLQQERADDQLARRRRRRTRSWLAAAAVVVVVGVGGTAVLDQLDTGGGDAASDSAPDNTNSDAGSGTLESDKQPGAAPRASDELDTAYAAHGAPTVTADTFPADAADVAAQLSGAGPTEEPSSTHFDCTPAEWGTGTLQPVTFEGDPAVLALRPPHDGVRTADLLACGTGEVLLTTSLPVS